MFKKFAAALPAIALVATPVMASAAQPVAQKLSISNVVAKRAMVKSGKSNQAIESGIIILILAGAAVAAGVVAATTGDSDPESA
ncbi:MAG: hypothetical protein V4537_16530 [Pseudomonadota bacterium]